MKDDVQPLHLQQAARKQHLIPRTYMRNWCYSGDSVWTLDKQNRPHQICSRNIDNINKINYHYDIEAGDHFITVDSLKHIFGFLSDYEIFYEGEKLDYLSMNNYYSCFHQWVITKPNGRSVNKTERNTIKSTLKKSRYPFIEIEWNKQYENNWNSFIHDIKSKVECMKTGGQDQLSYDDLEKLMHYVIMYDWRSKSGNSFLNEIIDWFCDILPEFKMIGIPFDDRIHREDKTVYDELKSHYRRKAYYEFLNNHGSMKSTVNSYLQHLTFVFFITDSVNPFITSDNPSFMFTTENSQNEHVLVALPTLLITTCKKVNGMEVVISDLSANEVSYYNKIIANIGELLILPNNTMNISLFDIDTH